MLSIILMVFAFVLFIISAFVAPQPEPWRGRLVCFGFACMALADLFTKTGLLNSR